MEDKLLCFYKVWFSSTNRNSILEICNQLLQDAEFTSLNFIEHFFQPQGYTALWLLAESHLAIHTFPEHNTTFLELCSCSQEKLDKFKLHFSNTILYNGNT